jgi:hypothetical protein
MWKLSEIVPGVQYVVQLCHDSEGYRSLRLRAVDGEPRAADAVFETEVVPHELLMFRSAERIAEEVRLSDGGTFEVDAHGIWFTPQELDAIDECDGNIAEIAWSTGTPPLIAPR